MLQAQGLPEGGKDVPKIAERPPQSLRGLIGEVWQSGQRVGTLWKWDLQGKNGSWGGRVQKYSLDAGFDGEAEFRLQIQAKGVQILELRAEGRIVSPYVADGTMQNGSIELRGTALAVA